MTDISILEDQAKAANSALYAAKEREAHKRNLALIGKSFRYRNSYSCPEKPSDYFWLYLRVMSVEGLTINCLTFQTDNRGRVEIDTRHQKYSGGLSDGYRPITKGQFDRAWRALQKRITTLSIR